MLFSLTNPEVAILMMGMFLFAVLLGFPIAFTLMAMGIGFGYFAYYDATMMEHIFDNRIFQLFVQNTYTVMDNNVLTAVPWGGLGLRVETRGFQWNNPQARDAIFWEYNISNTSEYDLPEVCFGYWVDNAIGGDENIVQVEAGYQYNLDKEIVVKIDNTSFSFYSTEDSNETAWTDNDSKVIYAMKKGLKLILSGQSSRGTITNDTYTLKAQ